MQCRIPVPILATADNMYNYTSTDDYYVEYDVIWWVWCICSPIILSVGTVGNTLNVYTLRGKYMSKKKSSLYLIALSIADTGALFFGLLPYWIDFQFGYGILTQHVIICRLRAFLFYSCSDVSVWLICAFTFDRLLAVVYPFKKKVVCTRRRIYMAIGLLVVMATVKNVTALLTRDIVVNINTNQSSCTNSQTKGVYYNKYIRPWIVLTLVNFIPFVFITASNIVIIYYVHKMARTIATAALSGSNQDNNMRRTRLASMTRMCLSVSCAFLLFISPSTILIVGKPHWTSTPQSLAKYDLAICFGSMCQYTSNAINFFLYCLSGPTFRRVLRRRFAGKSKCTRDKRTHSSGVQEDQGSYSNSRLRISPTMQLVGTVENTTFRHPMGIQQDMDPGCSNPAVCS